MIDEPCRTTGPTIRTQPLAREDVYYLLSNRRRRYVLSYLFEERSVPLGELVSHVVDREFERSERSDRSDRRAAVYASLYQTHIPELTDAGVVVHETDDNEVSITDTGLRLYPYLNPPISDGLRWRTVFLAQSLVWIGVAVGFRWIGITPTIWLLVGCSATFLCTSLGYYWWIRRRTSPSNGLLSKQ